jgi:hypothetical protein
LLALLFAAATGSAAARSDCPGCGLAILVPPAELLALDLPTTLVWEIGGDLSDHPVAFGRTFLWGVSGGVLGFTAGSLLAYPFAGGGFSAMGLGGCLVGLPLGMLVGQFLSLAAPDAAESMSSGLVPHGFRLAVIPLPDRTRVEALYGF